MPNYLVIYVDKYIYSQARTLGVPGGRIQWNGGAGASRFAAADIVNRLDSILSFK